MDDIDKELVWRIIRLALLITCITLIGIVLD